MSLLDDFARTCVLLEKTRKPDGEGGYTVEWADGAEFKNYQALDTSMEARRAEKEGVTSVYSALVDKAVPIEYNDYFREQANRSKIKARKWPAFRSNFSRQKRGPYRHDQRSGFAGVLRALFTLLRVERRAG